MEVYDRKDFAGKQLYDYISNKSPIKDGIAPVAIFNRELSAGDIITTKNSAYKIDYIFNRVTNDPDNKRWAVASKLPNKNAFITKHAGTIENTKLLTCPFCGYEDPDSWQFTDLEGICMCKNCKSTFSYKKKITVKYTTKPVSETTVHKF